VTALCALAALLSVSACQRTEEALPAEVRPVRVVKIESRADGGTVSLTGTVQAQTEINQSFRIDGRLVERTVDIGDTVRPGQLIARLDTQNEESGVQSARAQLIAARAQLVLAESNFTRMRDLVAEDAVSRAAFEQAEADKWWPIIKAANLKGD
jgi:multidrug efflux pump subunit AcrA (membrane-fusion protein)